MIELQAPTKATGSIRQETARARGAALRLLTLRPRSVAEMRERLSRRFDRDLVDQTVSRLEAEGLLNDSDFATQLRQSRERHKPKSRGAIAKELRQRGVSAEVIEGTLLDFDSNAAAHQAASRYASRQSQSDRATFDRRVGAFLQRRGFEPSIIRDTLRTLRGEMGIRQTNAAEYDDDRGE